MKDQELRDLFHAYRPQLSDEEEFMARLNKQMDSLTPTSSQREGFRFRWRLIWATSIAAAIVIALLVIKPTKDIEPTEATNFSANLDYQTMLTMTTNFPTFEETVAEIEQSGRQLEQTIAQLKEK